MKIVLLGTLLICWALLSWWCQSPPLNLTISYLLVCVGWTSWAYYSAPADRPNRENS